MLRAAQVAYLLALLLVTLLPGGASDASAVDFTLCFLCGVRGTADMVLNVLLFVPLGVLLAPALERRRRRILRRGARDTRAQQSDEPTLPRWRLALDALVVGLVVSLCIEVAQLWLPARHPSPADVLFNTGGAGIGTLLAAHTLMRADYPGALSASKRRVWTASWTVGGLLLLALTGSLLRTSVTDGALYGQWTPDLGQFDPYGGEVVYAFVGPEPVESRRLEQGREEAVRRLLRAEAPIEVRFIAGPPPDELAPIFSVFDGDQESILVLGALGEDLVYRRRYVADDVRLDRPDYRVRGALAGASVGDTVDVKLERLSEGGYLIEVDGGPRARVGHTLGRGWSLLYHQTDVPEAIETMADFFWLTVLVLPLGLLAASLPSLAASSLVLVGAAAVIPMLFPIWPTSLLEYGALFVGVLLGCAFRFVTATGLPPRFRGPR